MKAFGAFIPESLGPSQARNGRVSMLFLGNRSYEIFEIEERRSTWKALLHVKLVCRYPGRELLFPQIQHEFCSPFFMPQKHETVIVT